MDTEALILRIHQQVDLLSVVDLTDWYGRRLRGSNQNTWDLKNVCVCVFFFWEYLLRKTWNVISVFGSSCGLFGHCNNTVPNWKPSLVGSKFQGVTSYLIQSVHRSPSKSQIHKSDHKSYPPHMTSLLMPPSLDFQPGTSKCCIFANLPLCETEGAPSWDLFLQNSNEVHPDPSIAEACLPSFEKKKTSQQLLYSRPSLERCYHCWYQQKKKFQKENWWGMVESSGNLHGISRLHPRLMAMTICLAVWGRLVSGLHIIIPFK